MAEGEFNRYYARGVCVRALAENGPKATVTIYRARESLNPRSESVVLIGTTPSAAALLEDLRTNIGMDTALHLPRARTPASAFTSDLIRRQPSARQCAVQFGWHTAHRG